MMTREAMDMAQAIEYEHIVRTHERRAKKAIIEEKVAEFMAEGVDRSMAKIMAEALYEMGC